MEKQSIQDMTASTVPKNLRIALLGFPSQEFGQVFYEHLSIAITACSRVLDLERLAGVTVGYDLASAIASVDMGEPGVSPPSFTSTAEVECIAKAVTVKRDGIEKTHVVYSAAFIQDIVDDTLPGFQQALHLIAHELGHVAELKWRDESSPGLDEKLKDGNFADNLFLHTATAVWEEYAACRLTGFIGDVEALNEQYAKNFDESAGLYLERARDKIKDFRVHGSVDTLLLQAGTHTAMPLKLASYLLGHLDANQDETDIKVLCPTYSDSGLTALIPRLWTALRSTWNRMDDKKGLSVFDELKQVVIESYVNAGVNIRPQDEGYFVSAPFTAETMPNGEADMVKVRALQALGLL
ncbi:hypothetical protein [Stenotrophomonas maltophilia]|uniref:hypothetical protein n=1 Tax=Stenotrophomonas maltophilia TaxID=40324 RepID=UPI0015DDC0BB|nr:hypothetical protein [Stenotrophomonas maltophilia]